MIGNFLGGIWPQYISLDRLNDLNTTNYRIVQTTRLFTVAVFVALAMFVRESWLSHDESASKILDTVMLALFGFAGVNAAQYAAKRFSNTEMVAAKAGGAPAQVVQTTGTVIAQNPGGPVETGDTNNAAPVIAAPPPPVVKAPPVVREGAVRPTALDRDLDLGIEPTP